MARSDTTSSCQCRGVGSGTTARSDQSKKKFDDVRKCFGHQYNAGKSKDAAKPSLQDFISVMADNGAITPTFMVFQEFIAQKQIDKKSFKTEYNMRSDQFFFVAYVSNFCKTEVANPGRHRSVISNHDRVNIALKNSREFQAAFRCPAKTPMNPSHKCHLWSA